VLVIVAGAPFDLDCSCPASRNLPKSTIKPLHDTADAIAIVQMYDVCIHDYVCRKT